MAEQSHTPGPWSYSLESVDPEWAVVTTSGGSVIANVNADHRQEANARLIAAAPELLEALTYARTTIRLSLVMNGDDENASEIVRRIDAAISKATGGAQ